jgi:hypothetical protein
MTNAAIRQQLYQYIDVTDDKKVEALYTLLHDDMGHKYSFTEEEMNVLHECAEKYLSGEAKTYSVEEAHDVIRH